MSQRCLSARSEAEVVKECERPADFRSPLKRPSPPDRHEVRTRSAVAVIIRVVEQAEVSSEVGAINRVGVDAPSRVSAGAGVPLVVRRKSFSPVAAEAQAEINVSVGSGRACVVFELGDFVGDRDFNGAFQFRR
jgi:hypothetical protein